MYGYVNIEYTKYIYIYVHEYCAICQFLLQFQVEEYFIDTGKFDVQ